MLVDADGTVHDLVAPVGPPLGIGWRGPRADGRAVVPPGSTLHAHPEAGPRPPEAGPELLPPLPR
jgi:hypothetical protein